QRDTGRNRGDHSERIRSRAICRSGLCTVTNQWRAVEADRRNHYLPRAPSSALAIVEIPKESQSTTASFLGTKDFGELNGPGEAPDSGWRRDSWTSYPPGIAILLVSMDGYAMEMGKIIE
ncbi:unnamed protein product, partial [Linum tenue]